MSAKAKSKLTPEQQKATMTRVLQKIKPYGFFVVCSLIVAAVSVAAQLYIPILCGNAIDMMLGKGAVDFAGVLRIIYEIIVVAVVAAFAQWLLSVCNNRITFAVSRDLRNAAMRKIQTLPLSYLDSHPSGDIVSRMVADVDTFADGLLMGFTQLFSGVLTILGTLLFMLQQNVPITLVVVCITPLSLVVASFLAKRSYKYFQSQSTVRGEQTALVNEMIEGQKVVQAFGHEAQSLEAFDEVNGRLQNVSLKAIFFSSMTNPATRFVNNIVYAGVGLVGAIYAVAGGITIGQLSIFLNYANQYTKPFNEISGVVTELQNALACAARVFELLDAEDQTPEAENAAKLVPDGHVQIEDVSFRYLPDRPLIEGLSLDVKPGQRIAIVGPTGAGKTTTLYAALREINTIDSKVLTAEDPVEYDIDGIIQIPINEAIGLDFPMVLRAFLRQDPDRILVGEMRDMATAQIAIQASLTGHLVLSTLHTNDSAGAITRLVDMGCEPFLVAASLEGVLAQRLVRTICPDCRTPYEPSSTILSQLGVSPYELGDKHFFTGRGCDKCSNSGYRGRKGIYELLDINDTLRDMITDRAPSVVLKQKAIEMGMSTLREDGLRNIYDGNTTIEEVLKYT